MFNTKQDRVIDSSIEKGAKVLDEVFAKKHSISTSDMTEKKSAASLQGHNTKASLFDADGKKKSQSTILLDLCEHLKLFHDAELNTYAIIEKLDHCEIWPIQSRAFRNWLSNQYYILTEQGARGQNIGDVLATLEAKAQHNSPQHKVYMRVAWLEDRIYIDLSDEKWRVVEIDLLGWRILDKSPVMFLRRIGMAPLPIPIKGSLTDISKLVNVSQEDMPLVIGWILMAARGRGPYPIMVVHGEQGTGKSTFTRILRNLIDPSTVPLRGLNKDIRDLLVTATNNHVVVLDNLSGLTPEMSDALCRFATGGGFAERQLYTNKDEVIVNIQRPVILNGIDEIATRGDLMERSIILHLPVIPDTERTDEAASWKRYDDMRPGLLGGLYMALSHALRELPKTHLIRKPRMADFALWVTAAKCALGWTENTFMESYRNNQDAGTETALESSPFGDALLSFMEKRPYWSGTASELLSTLERNTHDHSKKSQSWPRSGKGVSNALRRLSPLLRRIGISITFGQRAGQNGNRIIEIVKSTEQSSVPSVSSKSNDGAEFGSDDVMTKHKLTIQTVSVSAALNLNNGAVSDGAGFTDDTFHEQTTHSNNYAPRGLSALDNPLAEEDYEAEERLAIQEF